MCLNMPNSSAKPIVGYWDSRGFGTTIRLLLTYLQVEFEDKRYSREEWAIEIAKGNLDLDFPNLPYYIDQTSNIKLTQTLAILQHLGRKYNLEGSTEQEQNQIAVLEQQTADLILDYIHFDHLYATDTLKTDFIKRTSGQLILLDKYLSGKKFGAGAKLTYVDFYLNEYLYWIHNHGTAVGILNNLNNVKKYVYRIGQLPRVKEYLQEFY